MHCSRVWSMETCVCCSKLVNDAVRKPKKVTKLPNGVVESWFGVCICEFCSLDMAI